MIKRILAPLFCPPALAVRAEALNIDSAELVCLTARGVSFIDIRTAGEWKATGVIAGNRCQVA